jgi:hypothetical protein
MNPSSVQEKAASGCCHFRTILSSSSILCSQHVFFVITSVKEKAARLLKASGHAVMIYG